MRLDQYLPLSKLNSAAFVLATDVAEMSRGAAPEIYADSIAKQIADARAALDEIEAACLATAPSRKDA